MRSRPCDDIPLARLRQVVLPQLAPFVAASGRIGSAMIWKIVLEVEFLGRSDGAGFMIHLQFQLFVIGRVAAWSVNFVAVMLGLDYGLVPPWERAASRWRRSTAA